MKKLIRYDRESGGKPSVRAAAYCPRCGAPMSGGVCDNCGFPVTGIRFLL